MDAGNYYEDLGLTKSLINPYSLGLGFCWTTLFSTLYAGWEMVGNIVCVESVTRGINAVWVDLKVCLAMPKRKRKNQSKPAPDFVKKKRKVGKVKKKEEPLCFKSKSVVVPSQLEVCLGPTTYRKQNVQVLAYYVQVTNDVS